MHYSMVFKLYLNKKILKKNIARVEDYYTFRNVIRNTNREEILMGSKYRTKKDSIKD